MVQDVPTVEKRGQNASSSSAAPDIEIQLPRTEKRTHEVEDGSTTEVDHNGWKLAKTVEGLEVCALGDDHEEWLDKPDQMTSWKRMTTEVRIADVQDHFRRMPFRPPSEEGLVTENMCFRLDQGNHCATKL